MSEQHKTLTFTETDLNRVACLLDYLLDSESNSFEEYMIEHFNSSFDLEDEDAVEAALLNDRVHHIFKTAELFTRAFENQ